MSDKTQHNDELERPYFQQLQMQFAEHIRNPAVAYAPEGEAPIEPRRLEAYESLFYNNIDGFFSNLFPVCKLILGDSRWHELMREYMTKHQARTPLFHELGEEFLAFLNDEYEALESDPEFLLELAHYEWVELAISVNPEEGFEPLDKDSQAAEPSLDSIYQLSPVAWPLAYQWPVHLLSIDYQPEQPEGGITTLLAYRNSNDTVNFIELTPLLYQWVLMIEDGADSGLSAGDAFMEMTEEMELDEAEVQSFAIQTLQQLINLNVIRPVK
ncbi:MAG: putative DNA-binding domain-containing protein [Pseudomonadota bacterium]|nr:putative DNA-binding domain-containing protein [Pseudomonadota bacterium]